MENDSYLSIQVVNLLCKILISGGGLLFLKPSCLARHQASVVRPSTFSNDISPEADSYHTSHTASIGSRNE